MNIIDTDEKKKLLTGNIPLQLKNKTRNQRIVNKLKKLILACIAIILIILGISMIVITAPSAAFEIATIYYFNPNDGITITDLISLIIILCGLYLLLISLTSD